MNLLPTTFRGPSLAAAVLLTSAMALLVGGSASAATSFAPVIAQVQPKIVKIYGAGGFNGMAHYQSGFLISADGFVLTAWSYVLDSDVVNVILNDGRKFKAELKGIDPKLELAVLKIDAKELPFFELAKTATPEEGSRVLAFSNLFGVATGDEAASVLHGILSIQTKLEARRGVYETPYQGPVYVVDAMTNNPGAAGGALTNLHGELIAMLGKELKNARNNTWLNYAVPINELREAVNEIRAGKVRPRADSQAKKAKDPLELSMLGLNLVNTGLERAPPFIDQVYGDSPAAKAGLRTDDLIVFLDNQLVQNSKSLRAEMLRIERDEAIRLTVMRDGQLMEFTLQAPASDEPRSEKPARRSEDDRDER